jgi:hypothetical protein
MGTDGHIERGFAHTEPDLSFEPLPVILDQVHDSDRGRADVAGDTNHIIEFDLTRRIEDAVLSQSSKTLSFMPRWSAMLVWDGIVTATHGTNLDRSWSGWRHRLTKVNCMSRNQFKLSG